MFFVATAPSGDGGHVNCSPKGMDTFRVISPTEVAWLDHVGSGAETIAHLRQNGRIVVMFCAFEGPARILRIHGRGETVEPADPRFAPLRSRFPAEAPAVRSVILVSVTRVAESCGWGVPLYAWQGSRTQLQEWADKKGPDGLEEYQRQKNGSSLDGLPALRWVAPGP